MRRRRPEDPRLGPAMPVVEIPRETRRYAIDLSVLKDCTSFKAAETLAAAVCDAVIGLSPTAALSVQRLELAPDDHEPTDETGVTFCGDTSHGHGPHGECTGPAVAVEDHRPEVDLAPAPTIPLQPEKSHDDVTAELVQTTREAAAALEEALRQLRVRGVRTSLDIHMEGSAGHSTIKQPTALTVQAHRIVKL